MLGPPYIYVCVYVYTCIHMCMNVYIYIYMYIYVYMWAPSLEHLVRGHWGLLGLMKIYKGLVGLVSLGGLYFVVARSPSHLKGLGVSL